MTEIQAEGLSQPHILIVSPDAILKQRLGHAFRPLGVGYESVPGASPAIARLDGVEPPVTGVITEALRGDYSRVIEAAKEARARAVLLATSSITLREAEEAGIAVFLKAKLSGRARQGNTTIGELVKYLLPEAV